MGVLGMEKFDESATVSKICSFQKRAPYQKGGCPDTLDTLPGSAFVLGNCATTLVNQFDSSAEYFSQFQKLQVYMYLY